MRPGVLADRAAFNHPSERALAELLTYSGVEWRYEPTTFALATDPAGRIAEAFTPDFYLPGEDLYPELGA